MIHILWCTIRTANFPNVYKYWIDRCKFKDKIKTHVLVSTESESNFLKQYFESINQPVRLVVFKPEYAGVCLPSYKLSSTLEYNQDDIIIFGSDDFTPPQNWDEYLQNKLSNQNGVLMVRDGYQLPDSSNMLHPAITIPIMTGSALEKMNNVIYHPAYHHMFSDCELYLTAKELGLLIDDRINDSTLFEHHHWAAKKRNADQNDQAYYSKWKDDEITWNQRKSIPLQERILVS